MHQWSLKFQPIHIWNVDELCIGDVSQQQKVIGVVLTYVCIAGLHVSPIIIFKSVRVKPEWWEYAPSGYCIWASDSSYISTKLLQSMGRNLLNSSGSQILMTPSINHLVLIDLAY